MGTIVAEQHSELSFERSGTLTLIQLKEGQFIKKGSVIAQLNNQGLLLKHLKQLAIIE